MSPSECRLILVHILELIAALEDEPSGTRSGARRAALLLHHGRTREALAALRRSESRFVAGLADHIAFRLPAEQDDPIAGHVATVSNGGSHG